MNYEQLSTVLSSTGIPFACHHWEEVQPTPYGVYFDERANNFAADGIVYFSVPHYIVELYIPQRDPVTEGKVESALTNAGIYWRKGAAWVEDLRLFQVYYEFEV